MGTFGTTRTLQTFPKPIFDIASFFHSGNYGMNSIVFFFKTPRGTAITTLYAEALNPF